MKFVHSIEGLSLWVGRAFGWCILILTLSVSYEVFVRYVLNAPTVWAFDMMVQMYGALFLMCGAYALAQDTHVRADVLYRLFPVKVQAVLDFVLYFLFFFPGVIALAWYGFQIADPAGRCAAGHSGHRRTGALRLCHAHRRLARTTGRCERNRRPAHRGRYRRDPRHHPRSQISRSALHER